uniref:Uncharacterized protein n=1 Tax=Panagrolaimus sp. JU765 TaxID=591449 RepID=A0AC34RG62_9BILA
MTPTIANPFWFDSCPKINSLETFLHNSDQEVRIVDHCFRQRDPESIAEIARLLVKDYNLLARDFLFDGKLKTCNFLPVNPQNFASFCVKGLSDQNSE